MLDLEKKKALAGIYGDITSPGSFSGLNSLYREAIKHDIDVSLSDVKKFLSQVPTYGVYHPQRKKFQRSRGKSYCWKEVF
jgi:hypothetical protein